PVIGATTCARPQRQEHVPSGGSRRGICHRPAPPRCRFFHTEFPDFEAFWHPFTLGAGPAPGYCMSLSDEKREALKARLAEKLDQGGPVRLSARAWAMKSVKGG
ncbi:hypothetical protein RXV88_23550, partial [Aestuariicoccus sp. MJ-SS9]|nr:hypothetical protein [Aestuariicoccus sp. MJ-SS9]